MKLNGIICLLTATIFMCSCGSNKNLQKTETGKIPDWYLNIPNDSENLYSAKSETSQDMQLAIDKATANARSEISKQVDLQISQLGKRWVEEIGEGENSALYSQYTDATKSVSLNSLSGTKIQKSTIIKDGIRYRAYVLVLYPLGSANKLLIEALQKNNHVWTRFQGTKAFNELNKEMESYEKQKYKQ